MGSKPTIRRCPRCGSYQITEHRSVVADRVTLAWRCGACRNSLPFFEGTAAQVRAFKRKRRAVQRKLDAAARG